jgi:hypothetical protein
MQHMAAKRIPARAYAGWLYKHRTPFPRHAGLQGCKSGCQRTYLAGIGAHLVLVLVVGDGFGGGC